MKTAKGFLAILFTLTLCLVPMGMSVFATEGAATLHCKIEGTDIGLQGVEYQLFDFDGTNFSYLSTHTSDTNGLINIGFTDSTGVFAFRIATIPPGYSIDPNDEEITFQIDTNSPDLAYFVKTIYFTKNAELELGDVDFGSIAENQLPVTKIVPIKNIGTREAKNISVDLAGSGFALGPVPSSINGGSTDEMEIILDSQSGAGTYTAVVTVSYEDGENRQVSADLTYTVVNAYTHPGNSASSTTATTRSSSGGSGGTTATPSTSKSTVTPQQVGEYSWRVDLPVLGFVEASVDGVPLVKGEDCIVKSGSTILSLTDSYVNSLRSGTHTLRMEFLSATATIDFTVTPTGSGTGVMEGEFPVQQGADNDNMNPSTGGVEAAGSIAVLLAVVGLWTVLPRKMGK